MGSAVQTQMARALPQDVFASFPLHHRFPAFSIGRMTTAYFDCFSGISGDMTLGALVDLGLPIDGLRSALKSLPVQGYTIESKRVMRCGIGATYVTVRSDEHHPHRHFSHIRKIIEGSGLAPRVKERAVDAFHRIAVAEAAIHETTVEKIHFHEVGAVDAIVDIVGAMWGLDELGIGRVEASPVAVGSGTVRAAHGEMPVPAPATARLLEGIPVCTGPVAGELATPTGAAILATVCERFGPLENFSISKIGYGAGTREYEKHTNYLRVLVGQSAGAGTGLPVDRQELAMITTEIDDMPAELFGHVLEQLFAAGCLDACAVPVQMKKNRPGTSLQVLVEPGRVESTLELLFRETTTFGVKVVRCDRYALRRRQESVETELGPVQVKVGLWGDSVLKATPEYEDCRRIAAERQVPLARVFAIVNAALTRSQ